MAAKSSASSSTIDATAEFDNLGSLEENEKGSVHGVVGQVSPMTVGKTGKGYFHALLTDGARDVKIVGFGKSQRNILKDFEEKGEPVAFEGCRIKRSRYTSDMEVILRPETNLTLSPKKIKVDPDRFAVENSDINALHSPSMSSTDRSVRMRPRATRKRSRPCLFRSLRSPTNALHSPSNVHILCLFNNFGNFVCNVV